MPSLGCWRAFKPSLGVAPGFLVRGEHQGTAGVGRRIVWATPRPHQSVGGGWGIQSMFQVGKSGATGSASEGLECEWEAGGGGERLVWPSVPSSTPRNPQAPRPLGLRSISAPVPWLLMAIVRGEKDRDVFSLLALF